MGVPFVLVTHNAEASLSRTVYRHQPTRWKAAAYFADWLKTRRYEPRYLRTYDAVTAVSEPDRDSFVRDYGLRDVALVPPGVDADAFSAEVPVPERDRGVILCGSFLWEPKRLNLLRLLESTAFSAFEENGIQLHVVGQAERTLVDAVNRKYRGVVMTGPVADVQQYYRKCAVALVPELMGGGFKLKILEAAAMRRAIVGLAGAVTAPGFVAGEHYVEARDMEDLITATVRLMSEPSRVAGLSAAAHDLVRRQYTWAQSGERLVDAVMRAAAAAKRAEAL
jgi:glycosyltransferase involved in cell wall biosynthesis